ncbi:hypothetical protein F444_20531 [Phytophthora nicotianae P1976]|uniref:Uncharacterized protein n=1 Tax=Phytophthora nicotianae P1976 TaxID=1317066 RepID=A0A080Z4A5_PHYNI|nr:hypothetical protein F444_20531 [Phytophthora nicotianae P1976]
MPEIHLQMRCRNHPAHLLPCQHCRCWLYAPRARTGCDAHAGAVLEYKCPIAAPVTQYDDGEFFHPNGQQRSLILQAPVSSLYYRALKLDIPDSEDYTTVSASLNCESSDSVGWCLSHYVNDVAIGDDEGEEEEELEEGEEESRLNGEAIIARRKKYEAKRLAPKLLKGAVQTLPRDWSKLLQIGLFLRLMNRRSCHRIKWVCSRCE